MLILLATVCAQRLPVHRRFRRASFRSRTPGRLVGFIEADQGISFQAMRDKLATFVELVRADPAVESVVAFTGGGRRNSGSMFVGLKPLAERGISVDEVIARLRGKLAHEPGASLFLSPVQDIRIGGRQSERAVPVHAAGGRRSTSCARGSRRSGARCRQLPQLTDVNTDQQDKGLQTTLIIDRDAASRLGVTSRMVDTTLNDAFGQRQVSTIYNPLNQYRVVMEAAPEYWQSPDTFEGRACHHCGRQRGAAVVVQPLRSDDHAALGEPPGAVRRVDDFVQPSDRRVAVRRNRMRSTTRWRASACRRACTARSPAPRARSSSRCSSQSAVDPDRAPRRSTSCSACCTRATCIR